MFDFLGFLGGFFSPLAGLLPTIVNFVVALANVIINVLAQVGTFLLKGILYALDLITRAGKLLVHLFRVGFSGIFQRVVSFVGRISAWLNAKLTPIIKFLQRVRAWMDRFFKLYIKPYLDFLQRVRKYLLLLRLLHVKFAEDLDKRIVASEALVSNLFLTVRGYLNLALDTLNQLTDARKLARLVLVSVAGRRTAAATIRILTGLPIGYFFPNYKSNALPWEKPVTSAQQLLSPITNPPPSALLNPLGDLPLNFFAPGTPIPNDEGLDDGGDGYIGEGVIDEMLAREAEWEAAHADPYLIDDGVRATGGRVDSLTRFVLGGAKA